MKKLLIILVALCLLVSFGCNSVHEGTTTNAGKVTEGKVTTSGKTDKTVEFYDGVIGENKSEGHGEEFGYEAPEYVLDGAIRKTSGDMPGDYVIDGEYTIGGYDGQLKAGTLTAGEIKDLEDLEHWFSLWNESKWDQVKKSRGLYAENVITAKAPPMSEVKLVDGEKVLYSAVADINGRAILIFNEQYKGKTAEVVVGDLSTEVTLVPGMGVDLKDIQPKSATKLDLMLMIDTTGSMGDELEYLKVELKDVIERVRKEQNIDIRLSVNFYRDEGDEYVVKYFDFREDIDDCITILGEQYSFGGGDYPEAVHTAINNVLQHTWRPDAVKLCFFVLDAPPHEESEINGINSEILRDVTEMASQGIRFISVVSSGADIEVEILMRSFAVMTGGTYLFLTNDSGIGGDHQEPDDTDYEVEPLNDCMVRVIKEFVFAD